MQSKPPLRVPNFVGRLSIGIGYRRAAPVINLTTSFSVNRLIDAQAAGVLKVEYGREAFA